jgi:hypothetical protein
MPNATASGTETRSTAPSATATDTELHGDLSAVIEAHAGEVTTLRAAIEAKDGELAAVRGLLTAEIGRRRVSPEPANDDDRSPPPPSAAERKSARHAWDGLAGAVSPCSGTLLRNRSFPCYRATTSCQGRASHDVRLLP